MACVPNSLRCARRSRPDRAPIDETRAVPHSCGTSLPRSSTVTSADHSMGAQCAIVLVAEIETLVMPMRSTFGRSSGMAWMYVSMVNDGASCPSSSRTCFASCRRLGDGGRRTGAYRGSFDGA